MAYAPTPYGLNGKPRPAFGRAGAKTVPQPAWQPRHQAVPVPAFEPDSTSRPEPTFYADGNFGISRIFGRMFGVIGSDFATFFALVALFAIPERIAVHAVGMTSPASLSVSRIVLAISGLCLQLAVMHLALRRFAGVPATLGACAGKGLKGYVRALRLCSLSFLACLAATLLLVVPAIMLGLAWSLALPVYLAENTGVFATFRRSAELTRGHRWKLLGLFLLLGLGLGGIGFVLMPIWGLHGTMGAVTFIYSNWLMRLIISASTGLMLAAIYHEVTGAKEADAF